MSRHGIIASLIMIGAYVSSTNIGAARGDELSYETVMAGLNNPTAVAIQPDTGAIFVAESGARRIVRIDSDTHQAVPVIEEFSGSRFGDGPSFAMGPLGIAFLDKNTLLVGGGGKPDGEDLVYVCPLPQLGKPAVKAKDCLRFPPLSASGDELGEGDFFNVVTFANRVFVTSNGDDASGWIVRGSLTDGKPSGDLERFLATSKLTHSRAPEALTLSPHNNLVVGQMGETGEALDSVVSFFDPSDGRLLLRLTTDLFDLIALRYGPPKLPYRKSNLYALDFAWASPGDGKLVRLDAALDPADRQIVRTVTLAKLVYPTSMAFAPDGELYVTLLSSAEHPDVPDGSLIRFRPGL